MFLYCNADRNISCVIKDQLKAGQDPRCKRCGFSREIFYLKPCRCGTQLPPRIYEEGLAQRYINDTGEKGPFEWVGDSRYAVRCFICSASTPLMETPDAAISAWNKYCEAHQKEVKT